MVASEQSHLTPAEQAARAAFVSNLPPEVAQQITYKQDQARGAGLLQSDSGLISATARQARWQATKCPSLPCFSSGALSRQRGSAIGQRV